MRRMEPNPDEFFADINNQNWNKFDELLKEFGPELTKLESQVKLVIVRRLVKDFYKDSEALSRDIEKAKKSKVVVVPKDGPDPPPDLPADFKKRIEAREGSDVALIIQKKLYKPDVSYKHSRLSIPANQVRNEFLKPGEEAGVCSRDASNKMKHIEAVPMIGPSSPQHECRISLAKWEMKKGKGCNSSWTYNLVTTWNTVVQDNNLEEDMIIQVWSYKVDDRLHFALVRLGETSSNIFH